MRFLQVVNKSELEFTAGFYKHLPRPWFCLSLPATRELAIAIQLYFQSENNQSIEK